MKVSAQTKKTNRMSMKMFTCGTMFLVFFTKLSEASIHFDQCDSNSGRNSQLIDIMFHCRITFTLLLCYLSGLSYLSPQVWDLIKEDASKNFSDISSLQIKASLGNSAYLRHQKAARDKCLNILNFSTQKFLKVTSVSSTTFSSGRLYTKGERSDEAWKGLTLLSAGFLYSVLLSLLCVGVRLDFTLKL